MTKVQTQAVSASIGYLAPMTEMPVYYHGYPSHNNLISNDHNMLIQDARICDKKFTLKDHGFQLCHHPSAIRDFTDENEVSAKFYEEAECIVKTLTGARTVLLPAAVIQRHSDQRNNAVKPEQQPAYFCHSDFTAGSTSRKIVEYFPEVKDKLKNSRYAAYNLWRVLSPPPHDLPLAVCDARSVDASDVIIGENRYGDPAAPQVWGEIGLFRHNPEHRWYCFEDMMNYEVLVFCGYDSDPTFASFVPHTAFINPHCPPTTRPRWSVDYRCFAIFD